MRGLSAVLFVLAIGCGSKPAAGPAWPAPSTTAEDGGESLEPRVTAVAASIEASKDDDEEKPADQPEIVAKPGAAATDTEEKPATVSPPQPVTDDVIISEEIIIEIED